MAKKKNIWDHHILNRFGSKTCGCMHKREDERIFEWRKRLGKMGLVVVMLYTYDGMREM